MWFEHLRNKQAVTGVFGDNVPALEGLELGQISLNEPGELRVAVNLMDLPEPLPARWAENGFDRLQLRFSLLVDDLVLHRRPELPGAGRVAIRLEQNMFHLVSTNSFVEATARFVEARLDFYPYSSAEHEFPPRWNAV